jgi:hypothetical protein
VKRQWSPTVDGQTHEVRYEMNDYTGRFTLTIDQTLALQGRFSFIDQWRLYLGRGAVLLFPIAGSQAQVRVASKGMSWTAELTVDEARRAAPSAVLIPSIPIPPWWAWLCFGVALAATFAAIYVAYTTGVRRVPVAGLGAAGAFVCLRFSTNKEWPLALRVILNIVAAAATVALAKLSLP